MLVTAPLATPSSSNAITAANMAHSLTLTMPRDVHLTVANLVHSLPLDAPITSPFRYSTCKGERPIQQYIEEVRRLFEAPLHPVKLRTMSARLQQQFLEKLESSTMCMLPSYNHTLPTGHERGTVLALDVGGSTFRVALIQLHGQNNTEIVTSRSYPIGDEVRQLEGHAFFDWMADRIQESLAATTVSLSKEKPLPMGLAWSFPVEQRSVRSGSLLQMGKGFRATQGLLGEDLAEIIMKACSKKNLNVRMDAIVNDSAATLLSRAYQDSTTRVALILGTGTNAAIHLPVTALSPAKFGPRPKSWHEKANHVLVNTELSMFGKNVLPTTRWDDALNANHTNPDYQPLEHLISGRYLGEIVRLILVEAIQKAGLFDGQMPENFSKPYSLDTGTIAAIEADTSRYLNSACSCFVSSHPLPGNKPPSYRDLRHVYRIIKLVSSRATAYLATGIHALWTLRLQAEGLNFATADEIGIACDGTVLEKYPRFREQTQDWVDKLTGTAGKVKLEMACESALLGAAVAVSCADGGEATA